MLFVVVVVVRGREGDIIWRPVQRFVVHAKSNLTLKFAQRVDETSALLSRFFFSCRRLSRFFFVFLILLFSCLFFFARACNLVQSIDQFTLAGPSSNILLCAQVLLTDYTLGATSSQVNAVRKSLAMFNRPWNLNRATWNTPNHPRFLEETQCTFIKCNCANVKLFP